MTGEYLEETQSARMRVHTGVVQHSRVAFFPHTKYGEFVRDKDQHEENQRRTVYRDEQSDSEEEDSMDGDFDGQDRCSLEGSDEEEHESIANEALCIACDETFGKYVPNLADYDLTEEEDESCWVDCAEDETSDHEDV